MISSLTLRQRLRKRLSRFSERRYCFGHEISGNERNLLGVNEVSSVFSRYRNCFVALLRVNRILSQWTANDNSNTSRFLRLHQSHKILNHIS